MQKYLVYNNIGMWLSHNRSFQDVIFGLRTAFLLGLENYLYVCNEFDTYCMFMSYHFPSYVGTHYLITISTANHDPGNFKILSINTSASNRGWHSYPYWSKGE